MKGLVIKSTGSWYSILSEDQQTYNCRVRGKFKLKGFKTTNPLAVGDEVDFEMETSTDEPTGVIHHIYPRNNYIIRKSIHKTGHGHIIASNIDQLMILVTLAYPRTSFGFIDRLAVAAESFRIPVTLVFNKMDMLEDESLEYVEEIMVLYRSLGYECMAISATELQGLDKVETSLADKITLVAGHSGVGKSTLINQLNPEIGQKIGEVSMSVEKGTHTTTFAQMFELKKGMNIIDTPGIKEYGLVDISNQELSDYFPEMRDMIGHCKFHNCSHTHEPGCAIVEAVKNEKIAATRYTSYLSILEDEDNRR
jgi:ribosome biogenesis GTPase